MVLMVLAPYRLATCLVSSPVGQVCSWDKISESCFLYPQSFLTGLHYCGTKAINLSQDGFAAGSLIGPSSIPSKCLDFVPPVDVTLSC